MKLNSLSFSRYKNLENVSLNLERSNGIVAFAGRNGMGKSNFLEAIVLILQSARRNGYIGKGCPKEYAFSVEDNGKSIRCECNKGGFKCYINDEESVFPSDFPRQLVAVYSGDSRRLLREVESCDERFVYFDYRTIPVALAILLSSERESVKDFVKEIFHLPKKISIQIKVSNRRLHSNSIAEADRRLFRKLGSYTRNIVKLTPEALNNWIRTIGSEQDAFTYLTRNWQDGAKGFVRDIIICFENDKKAKIDASQLSEGEIKLAFFKAIYEFIAEDNSIILLDEPDAHVHEFWKIKLLHLFKSYAEIGRQTIFTTHSPGLINGVDANSLVSLATDESKRIFAVIDGDVSKLLSSLGVDRMAYYADKPIIMFEGKTDVEYLRKAFDCLDKSYLNNELLLFSYGGVGNVDFVYDNLRRIFHGKPIKVYCDKDSGGRDALRKMAKYFKIMDNQDSEQDAEDNQEIPDDILSKLKEHNIQYLPKPFDSENEYAIEDYFDCDFIFEAFTKEIRKGHICIKTLSRAGDNLKRALYSGGVDIPLCEFGLFAPLVRDVESFYRMTTGIPQKDVSFVVPIAFTPCQEYIDAQIKSFRTALDKEPAFSAELVIVDLRTEGLASDLSAYGTDIVDAKGMSLEKAIMIGVEKSIGDYVCVLWQHATIQNNVFKSLKKAVSFYPDYIMYDATMPDMQFEKLLCLEKGKELDNEVGIMVGRSCDLSHFCISRFLVNKLIKNHVSGMLSHKFGKWLLMSARSLWLAKKEISVWRDEVRAVPKIPDSDQGNEAIQIAISNCKWRKSP